MAKYGSLADTDRIRWEFFIRRLDDIVNVRWGALMEDFASMCVRTFASARKAGC